MIVLELLQASVWLDVSRLFCVPRFDSDVCSVPHAHATCV